MNAESVIKAAERRGAAWRHAFVYFWLVFTAVTVLVDERLTIPAAVTAGSLSAGLGAWYWYWQITRAAPGEAADRIANQHRVYLAGAGAAWLLLVAIDSGFLVTGVVVLAPYCFTRVRWALALLVLSVVGWLWQEAPTGLGWSEIVVALLILGCGAAVAGYMATLSRQNDERRRLIEQLRSAQAELAAAERHAGVLAERQRLARDIHDTLTQGFASIVMLLEAAEVALESSHGAAPHVAAALRSARDNLAESRRVVWALRPETGQPLPEAAGGLLARAEEETGMRAELVITGTPRRLGDDAETGLLRVIQEALTNVRKHAGATRVSATISYMDDVVVLDIQDDGVGFHPAGVAGRGGSGGLGLDSMRERAAELGGRFAVESAPGEGTTIMVELPDRSDASAEASR